MNELNDIIDVSTATGDGNPEIHTSRYMLRECPGGTWVEHWSGEGMVINKNSTEALLSWMIKKNTLDIDAALDHFWPQWF